MKLHIQCKNYSTYFFLVISLFLSSCKKENSSNNGANSGEQVSFNVSSIDFAINDDINNIAAVKSQFAEKPIVEDFENFSWELSTSSEDNKSTINHSYIDNQDQILLKASATNYAATTPMALGVKYMLLIYKIINGSESHIGSYPVSVGSSDFKVTLPKNSGQYAYYAYSYNNSEDLSSSIPSNLNNPVIPNKTDAPLLFAKGTFNLANNTDARVSMTFKHQAAKLELVIDGQLMFANSFQKLDVDFNNLTLTTQNYSLKNQSPIGEVLSTRVVNNQKIIFSNHQGLTSKQASNNKLYTSSINPNINITVKEVIIIQTGVQKTLISSNEPNKNASFKDFSSSSNAIKRALVTLKYKGGNIYPNEWAQGNLYYDPTDLTNPYKFADPVFQSQAEACNYYWNFNTVLPRSITGKNLSPVGDPCKEVLPKGSWRTPSVNDFSTLNVAFSGIGYVYFDAENGERVYFNEAGWITSSGCNVHNTNDGAYWSTSDHTTNKSYYLEIDERGGTGAGNRIHPEPKTYGMSIRCVRSL